MNRNLRSLKVGIVRRLAGVSLASFLTGCSTSPSHPLPLANVDLNRMYGGWYIIATIPNRFERGALQPYDVYSLRSDGDIREDFYVRFGRFDAPCRHFTVHDWVLPGTGNAVWRVQIMWPIRLPFLVGYVDPSYRFVIFGENDRKLGWIYARDPVVGNSDYLKELGYDPSRFKRFLQTPEQFDHPGYWSDKVTGATVLGGECAAQATTLSGKKFR
jgi:apolipoprotein D and lipocalin family protein